jgi:solute carrier family 25 (adenine nucleotide translocator) protein 4/5/6/31
MVKTARGPGGFLGLYKGFGVSVAGIIPYRGTQFGLNDTIKGLNPWDKDVSIVGIVSKFVGAQVSVTISGYAAYPFDTVRRRLQMEATKEAKDRLYKGTMHCFAKIVKDEGTTALFKGAGANVLRGVGAALVLVLYGEAQAFLSGGKSSGAVGGE